MVNNNNIKEVSIKVYKFTLFNKDISICLRSDQVDSFTIFFELLDKKVSLEEAKKEFVNHYLRNTSQSEKLINVNLDFNFIVKNFLGADDIMNNIEEFYKISIRDNKIDEITNE